MKSKQVQEFKETEIGKIPVDWEVSSLNDLCDSISVTHSFEKDTIIFLNTRDIKSGRILHNNYTSIEKLPGQAKKSIKKNDILFSEIRPKNKRHAFVDFQAQDFVVSTKLLVIRANDRIHPNFLYLFLTNSKTIDYLQMIAETRSGTFPQITFDEIKLLKIPLPTIEEQIRISDLISLMSNGINNLQKQNNILEQISQSIFQSWFVDFDGVMEFDDSELGKIPKGWIIKQLSDVTRIVDCLHITKPPEIENDAYLLQTFNIVEQGLINLSKKFHVSDEDYKFWTKNITVEEGDCIISNAGRVGAVAQIPYWLKGGIGRNLTAIRSEKISPTYLFEYLFSKSGQQEIKFQTDNATVFNTLNVRGIKKLRILIPDNHKILKYENIGRPLRKSIEVNALRIQDLTKTRDALLPKLMSGEIRV